MPTAAALVKARKVRSLQADIDKRTEAITKHKVSIKKARAELKHVRSTK